MAWCITCHRQYQAKFVENNGNYQAAVDCYTCHY